MSVVESFAEPRGWGIGVGTFDSDWGIQARKDFMFGEELQYAIDLQAGLYNQKKWTGRFNADFHYIFMSKSAFSLYPLAGLNFSLQDGRNRWGANIGGGMLLDIPDEGIVAIKCHPDGYVPMRISWNTDHFVPTIYQLTLKKGGTIGGKVYDAAGNPVESAKLLLILIRLAP